MADREILVKTALKGNLSNLGIAVTYTAANTGDKNRFLATGKEILVARNSNSGVTARTVTVTSAADYKGRIRDITAFSIAAGATAAFGPWKIDNPGWLQADGYIWFEGSHTEVLFAVLVIPDDF